MEQGGEAGERLRDRKDIKVADLETSTADLRATIQLQIGGELRKT